MSRSRILLTGATGCIAGRLLPAFRKRYDLRLVDLRDTHASEDRVKGGEVLALLSAIDSVLGPFFSSVGVVVRPLRALQAGGGQRTSARHTRAET